MTQYSQALQHWEEARQQHDFIATDKNTSLNTSEKVIFFSNSETVCTILQTSFCILLFLVTGS